MSASEIAIVKIRDDVEDVGLAGRYVRYMGQRVGRRSIAVQFAKETGLRYFPAECLNMKDRFIGHESDLDSYPYASEVKGHHVYKGKGRYTYSEDDAANPLFGQF